MARYKVLKGFKDKETKEHYKKGEEVNLLVKEAKDLNKRGRGHKDVLSDLLERVDEG